MIELLAIAVAVTGASQSNVDLRGTAGVCIRRDRPAHVADAAVVSVPATRRLMRRFQMLSEP
jgi:hypothetical protein